MKRPLLIFKSYKYINRHIILLVLYEQKQQLPPCRVPWGSNTSPSRVTLFIIILLSKVTFLALSMLLQTNVVPKTNSIAFCRSDSYIIRERAKFKLPWPAQKSNEMQLVCLKLYEVSNLKTISITSGIINTHLNLKKLKGYKGKQNQYIFKPCRNLCCNNH